MELEWKFIVNLNCFRLCHGELDLMTQDCWGQQISCASTLARLRSESSFNTVLVQPVGGNEKHQYDEEQEDHGLGVEHGLR